MIKKYFQLVSKYFKKGKAVAVLGIIGILLIGFSSFAPQKPKTQPTEVQTEEINHEEYRKMLEEQIKNIVVGITGDNTASVVITLETGVRYSYASETEENINDTVDDTKSDTASKIKKNYITVKTESGAEEALLVTQYMPDIRGVAVVCKSAQNSAVAENITNVITAALGITSKKVYVAAPVN